MIRPNGSMRSTTSETLQGRHATSTRPPSSGGIGRRLKIVSTTLINMPNTHIPSTHSPTAPPTRRTSPTISLPSSAQKTRHQQIRDGTRGRDDRHIALSIAEVPGVHRHGLRPAEHGTCGSEHEQPDRHEDRADRVDVLERIER